jgi:8-oxo-dGTP pyrophosphatase MutT (NUDIX family)
VTQSPANSTASAPAAAPDPAGPRPAAVLVPIYDGPQGPTLLFIRRTAGRTHSGQVAFPGGRPEPEDAGPEATALREAQEELGIPPERVRVLGRLPTVDTITSNFAIVPVVGRLRARPRLTLQANEVAAVLDVPLESLSAPGLPVEEDWALPLPGERLPPNVRVKPGQTRRIRYFPGGEDRIWGATARMVEHLLAALRAGTLRL